MNSPSLMFTSESVTEGHPDKVCDQISDAVLDACLEQDPVIAGGLRNRSKDRFCAAARRDHHATRRLILMIWSRKVILDIGYDASEKGLDGNTCGVLVALPKQSGDIALGVNKALEAKKGEMSDEEVEAIGAGDQGMMFGYACDETQTLDADADLPGAQAGSPVERGAQEWHAALASTRMAKPRSRWNTALGVQSGSIQSWSALSTLQRSARRDPRSADQSM